MASNSTKNMYFDYKIHGNYKLRNLFPLQRLDQKLEANNKIKITIFFIETWQLYSLNRPHQTKGNYNNSKSDILITVDLRDVFLLTKIETLIKNKSKF